MGLDAEWEKCLTRCTLEVQKALEEGVVLSLYPVEVAASPRVTGLVLGGNHTMRGQLGQECATPGATESYQHAGSRYITPAEQLGTPTRYGVGRRHPGWQYLCL